MNVIYDGDSNRSIGTSGSSRIRRASFLTTGTFGTAGASGTQAQRGQMICDGIGIIHTIGHSTRTIETFVELLSTHKIELLVDVRRWPMSRRHPHFNRDALSAALAENHIKYLWRQDLGGFRKPAVDSPNTAWQVAAFRAYADFMLSAPFESIITEIESLAANKRIALMCAEAVPWRCHRQLLADAFLVRGWSVRHIMENGCHEHKLAPFAQPEGKRIIYRGLV